jgi:hypothetical protein
MLVPDITLSGLYHSVEDPDEAIYPRGGPGKNVKATMTSLVLNVVVWNDYVRGKVI